MSAEIKSQSQVARELGVDRQTISDLVAKHSIPEVQHPSNGRAKGIDHSGFLKLRRLLTPIAST